MTRIVPGHPTITTPDPPFFWFDNATKGCVANGGVSVTGANPRHPLDRCWSAL